MKSMLNVLLFVSILFNILWGSVLAIKVVRVYDFIKRHVVDNGYCFNRGWHLKGMEEDYALFSRPGSCPTERDVMFVSGVHKVICEVVHADPTNNAMSVHLYVGGARVSFDLENSKSKNLDMRCGDGRVIDVDSKGNRGARNCGARP